MAAILKKRPHRLFQRRDVCRQSDLNSPMEKFSKNSCLRKSPEGAPFWYQAHGLLHAQALLLYERFVFNERKIFNKVSNKKTEYRLILLYRWTNELLPNVACGWHCIKWFNNSSREYWTCFRCYTKNILGLLCNTILKLFDFTNKSRMPFIYVLLKHYK